MTAIAIPETIRAAITPYARATFPAECCGYPRGARDGATVDAAITCTNAQASGEHPIAPERTAESGYLIWPRAVRVRAQLRHRVTRLASCSPLAHEWPRRISPTSITSRRCRAGVSRPARRDRRRRPRHRIAEVAQFAWSTARPRVRRKSHAGDAGARAYAAP